MRIKLDIDPSVREPEVIIRAGEETETITPALNLNTNFNTRTVECTSGFCGKIVFSLCRDASEACA